jgi:hypothetical protein
MVEQRQKGGDALRAVALRACLILSDKPPFFLRNAGRLADHFTALPNTTVSQVS